MTETEIKIRLDSLEDYHRLQKILGQPRSIEYQTNYYLDDSTGHFTSTKSTFRLRVVNGEKAFITYKSKTKLEHGIFQSNEIEEGINLGLVEPANHEKLYTSSAIYKKVLDLHKFVPANMKVLGLIKTTRSVYYLHGEKLELDDTDYGFDKNYEIEVETTNIKFKKELEEYLRDHNIKFADSKANKFTNFVKGRIQK